MLILGGAGMLGHKLVQQWAGRFEVWATFRGSADQYLQYGFYDRARTVSHVDVSSFDSVVGAIEDVKPDVVVNCIGIIKQLPSASDPIAALEINALFPHRVAAAASRLGVRLVHVSTDCVFSGLRGMYTESDVSDAGDLYGRTKFLGEISGPGMLTVRTSIIGRELQSCSGLVEWFLAQRGRIVHGWRQAIYTGLTTIALARILADVVEKHSDLSGVYQVASQPITKYALLCALRDAYGLNVTVEPDDGVKIDRSLDGKRFQAATGMTVPPWPIMLTEMAADQTPYDQWRLARAS